MTVERLSGETMRVTWKPLTLLEARGRVTNYTVYYWIEGTEASTAKTKIVSGNMTSINITELDATQAYLVAVAASTMAGMGNQTEPTKVLTLSSSTMIGMILPATLCHNMNKLKSSVHNL